MTIPKISLLAGLLVSVNTSGLTAQESSQTSPSEGTVTVERVVPGKVEPTPTEALTDGTPASAGSAATEAAKETPEGATVTKTKNTSEDVGETASANSPAGAVEEASKEKTETEILREEIARLSLEKEHLTAQSSLRREKLSLELADRREELDRQKLDMEERNQAMLLEALERKETIEAEYAKLRGETERMKVDKEVAAARAELRLNELKIAETELKAKMNSLIMEIGTREKELEIENYADQKPVYLDDPLDGRALVVSDRRIELNGAISSATADLVCDRIHYLNNKNGKHPIFIVIDSSPGGSVMAGYRILKAMEGSDAPVYVVVKSYAASMAACIATLAKRSFAYPNAVLIHHQIASLAYGNLTQQREGLKEMEKWWRRLAEPIAQKMGISRDEFIKRMYSEVSSGDWTEFADDAVKLKWVDHIVDEIRETALVKNPGFRKTPSTLTTIRKSETGIERPVYRTIEGFIEEIDADGTPYVRLPRPNPVDVYYMHNPDNYYRFR